MVDHGTSPLSLPKVNKKPLSSKKSFRTSRAWTRPTSITLTNSNKQSIKLEQSSTKLGQRTQRKWKFPSIPNNGGPTNANGPSKTTGHQEVLKTGRNSRRLSKTSRDPTSMTKFKKLRTRVEAPGNWWIGLSEENSPLSRLSTTMVNRASLSTAYGMLSISLSILLKTAKLTSTFLVKSSANHPKSGVRSPKTNFFQRSASVRTLRLQAPTSFRGVTWSPLSKTMIA